ncbi:hypothetical protein AVEN_225829-1 [Araneus ventricosus]|uniref:Endonuclease/exonuclease/phosphatase domain-containing protein n=1 Tax=Araneus ventricosus TaxID=182803 RepID=A0A4Y2BAQ4_ARAVE|nr:hypothetical protein AVEN_225829-1 [Araneus ventricosus]
MPNTPNNTVEWGFFQVNLGRSKVATKELPNLISNFTPDIYLIQEPYVGKNKVIGLPLSWKILAKEDGRALVAVRNKDINVMARHVSRDIVVVDLLSGANQTTVVSIYIPPSRNKSNAIMELEEVLANLDVKNFILGGDINMRNVLWGPDIPDHRASEDGGAFVDFVLKHNLRIINNPNSLSTFETKNGKSWIDITISSRDLFSKISDWTVTKCVFSDHSYLSFKFAVVSGAPIGLGLRISKRKIYRLGNLVAEKFRHAEEELNQIKTKRDLETWVQRLTEFIQSVCKRTAPAKAAHLRVPWWDHELEIQRKKTRALRFRYQRCKNDQERLLRRSIFKREEAKYKWLIKTKSRKSFEKLCVLLTSTNPFDLPYRLATGKTKKQMIFNTVRDERGLKTKSIDETISAIS